MRFRLLMMREVHRVRFWEVETFSDGLVGLAARFAGNQRVVLDAELWQRSLGVRGASLSMNQMSAEVRKPPEFKHITKGRKRN